MCQLPPKKPNIEKKTNIFLTPTVSKKSQICEIWRQKRKSGSPGEPRRPVLFFICWPVSDDSDSSSPEVKIPPCLHTWFWMAWPVEFCCADRLGPEKLLILLHWFGTQPWLGSTHLCELCTWFTAHWHCSVAKLRDRTCELL